MILIILFISLFALPILIALGRVFYYGIKLGNIEEKATKNYEAFEKECKQCTKKNRDGTTTLARKENIAKKYGLKVSSGWYGDYEVESKEAYIERLSEGVKRAADEHSWEGTWGDALSPKGWFCVIMIGIGLVASMITGGIAIGENMSWNVRKTEISINEQIDELYNNKCVLIKQKESYSLIEWNKLAFAHNEKAKNFYIDIQNGQVNRSNPWISWMCSPAYDKYNISEIKEKCTITLTENIYTTYTGE